MQLFDSYWSLVDHYNSACTDTVNASCHAAHRDRALCVWVATLRRKAAERLWNPHLRVEEPTSGLKNQILNTKILASKCVNSILRYECTERKTDPKSRYFPILESTFEKCLIQLSVELIQPNNPCNSMNHTQYRVESALPRVESE